MLLYGKAALSIFHFPFSIFSASLTPKDQKGSGDEDAGVGAEQDADDECQHEPLDAGAAEQEQRGKHFLHHLDHLKIYLFYHDLLVW